MFDNRSSDAHRVTLLKGIQADGVGRYLAGHNHHWNAVHVRRRDTSNSIRYARPGGHQSDANLASRARIAISSVDSRLLMPNQDMLN